MKNFKRIISFVMAMIIFTSFCCLNSGAEFRNFYESGTKYKMFTYNDDNLSEACASITNWGYDEEDNDLFAETWAHSGGIANCRALCAVSGVSVLLDDYTGRSGESEIFYLYGAEWMYAYHEGGQYDDFDHCVIGFDTSHKVYVIQYINGFIDSQYGDTFYIGTSS